MPNTDKYLLALGGEEVSSARAGSGGWPSAIKRKVFDFEHPVIGQFLDDHCIDQYLQSLQPVPPGRMNGSSRHRRFPAQFAGLGRQWKADQHPLMLCEFLAYKSGLAYRSPREIRNDLLGLDSQGRRYNEGIDQYAFFDSSERYGDTQAFAFVHQRTGFIIFRGTSSFRDIATDFYEDPTTETYPVLETLPQTLVASPRPARHTGFAIAWGSVAPDIEAWVRDQMQHGRIDNVVFSGHSLGGALAILGAHHFAHRRICPIDAVVTFGSPLVGGADFKSDYESPRLGLKDRTLRVESAEDVIVHIAKGGLDYHHVGHAWQFKLRPLRPIWQMILFSPLIGAEQVTRKKVERLHKKADAKAAGKTAQKSQRSFGSNVEPAKPQRTWRQFFIHLALKLAWFIIGLIVRAVAAHSVERRYGLYLSTLSYRKIRAHRVDHAKLLLLTRRGQENERILLEKAFHDAEEDLRLHLGFIRGRHPRTFRKLLNRPIRIDSPAELARLAKDYVSYIA